MPDLTLVQKLVLAMGAFVAAVGTVLVSFDVISVGQSAALGGPFITLGAVLAAADAVIRSGRSRALANPESVEELKRQKRDAVVNR